MSIVVVTGSAGLIGSEAAHYYCQQKYDVIGIDNNFRRSFFGAEACTDWNRQRLEQAHPNYTHLEADIRDPEAMESLFRRIGPDLALIVHAAAQPSHDWAASDPLMDFTVNANGTLIMLENFRRHAPQAVFLFTSTNKVYGDTPNRLPLVEQETRWEIAEGHPWQGGIDETMSIDRCKHSLFGASKVAADVLVQEYGIYFGLKTGLFRGGCLTGPSHSGTRLHGFLSYLMRCCITGKKYTIYGYKGKQVRDNIHASDFIGAIDAFFHNPRQGEVYNMGGGRFSNCSVLEAIELCQEVSGRRLDYELSPVNREGDHIWWISGLDKFRDHYPDWRLTISLRAMAEEIFNMQKQVA